MHKSGPQGSSFSLTLAVVNITLRQRPTHLLLGIEIAMTPTQLRAARALLNWSRKDLRQVSGISAETIQNIENGKCNPMPATLDKLMRSFADHGVKFIGDRQMQGVVMISRALRKPSHRSLRNKAEKR